MIALLFLLTTTFAGYGIVSFFFPKISISERASLGWLLGVLGSSWITLIGVALLGYTWGIISTLVLSTMMIWKLFSQFEKLPKWSNQHLPLIIFFIIWVSIFWALFQRHLLPSSDSGWFSSINSYGDLALHSTYINYFANQEELYLISPIYSQNHIQYPFLFNFHTSLLLKTGLSLHLALLITSLLTITASLHLFYNFCWQITKSWVTPFLASIFYFLNGGVGSYYCYFDWKNSGQSILQFLSQIPKDYAHIPEQKLFWGNVITTHLLPQRGFLIGFACFMFFLRLWQILWYNKKIAPLHLLFIGIFVGLLPLFHSHTYLVTLPLFGWLLGWGWYSKKIIWQEALIAFMPAVLIGGMQLLYLQPESSQHFIRLQLGWRAESNLLSFWLQSMGISFLLMLFTPIVFWHMFQQKAYEKILLFPFVSIFVICNIFVFQPNDWDNMKFFLLGFVVIATCAAAVFTRLGKNRYLLAVLISITVFASISGALSVMHALQVSWQLASPRDIQLAETIKETTPVQSVFLTSDRHNHPIPMIAGRAVVRGYRGWLWTHGIDYATTDQDIIDIYSGKPTATDLIHKYKITYVFIGPSEKIDYPVNQAFFKENYEAVYQDGSATLYKVSY